MHIMFSGHLSARRFINFGFIIFMVIMQNLGAAQWIFFGTYTAGSSQGIYVSQLDDAGNISPPKLAAEIINPSFLAVDSQNKFLYAISETTSAPKKKNGDVAAFALDAKTGALTRLNAQPSGGDVLCHIGLDTAGKTAMVASYGGGTISALPIKADGSLDRATSFIQHRGSSVNPRNQTSPHAHQIICDPSGKFALVCDLGMDKVLTYALDSKTSTLSSNAVATTTIDPGSGPRHLTFHPNGKWVYLINEMGCSVITFEFDSKKGSLNELQTISTLPEGQTNNPTLSGAEVVVHPSGKFLYASTRGLNLINVFSVDETTGKLAKIQDVFSGGKTPRHFNLDRTGRFLVAANQNSDNVTVFSVDQNSGKLTLTGQTLNIGNPSCAIFVPAE